MHELVKDLRNTHRRWWLLGAVTAAAIILVLFRGGPGPGMVAAQFQQEWDQGNWAAVWELSAPELRAGDTEAEFVSLKERTRSPDLSGDLERVVIEREETRADGACVVLRLDLRDAGERVREVLLRNVDGTWRVVDPELPAGDCPLILNYVVALARGHDV